MTFSGGVVDIDSGDCDSLIQDHRDGLILQEFETVAGIKLPDGRYETVAGFMIDRLGRLPKTRDRVEVPGHLLRVLAMDRLRIGRIRVTSVTGADTDDG